MPAYKLFYFNGRGAAEVARILFAAGGQSFDDVRVTQEDWPKHKPKTPFGQMPVLLVDGKMYAQSVAINSYLAREFGFYGKTNLDGLAIDQVTQLITEVVACFAKFFFEKDEAKKAEIKKNFEENDLPKFMGFLIKLLGESKTGFFVGSSLTLADLVVFNLTGELEIRGVTVFEKFPELKTHHDKVLSSSPKIKTYIANRKD